MRALTALTTATLLAVALSACGGSDDDESNGSNGQGSDQPAADVSVESLDLACTFAPDESASTISLGRVSITGTNTTDEMLSQAMVTYKLTGPDGDLELDGVQPTFVTYFLPGEQLEKWVPVLGGGDGSPAPEVEGCEVTEVSVSTLAGEPTIEPEGATCEATSLGDQWNLEVDLSGVEGFPADTDQFIGTRELTASGARYHLHEETLPAGETTLTLSATSNDEPTCDVLYFRDL